jgi:nucleotide-binding universal stress UspA family protein
VAPGSDAIPEKLMDCELRRHLLAQSREQLLALASRANVRATILTDSGEVSKVVHRFAQEQKADLVVIGRGHHTGFGRLRTHSYSIIRESPCPVLSI